MASPKLALSFIEQKPFAITKYSWQALMLLMVSLFLLAYVFYLYQNTAQTIEEFNHEISLVSLKVAKKQAGIKPKVTVEPEIKLSKNEIKQINETVSELTVSWETLFSTIEQTLINDVALLEISPNSKRKTITIRGEAKDLKKVFEYIKSLDDSPIFTKVHLDTHSIGEESLGQPIIFTLAAEWVISGQE